MSKKILTGSDSRQPSLLGFISKKATNPATVNSSSVSSFKKLTQIALTENGQSATSTPNALGSAVPSVKSKFKYVPVKRKNESLIEISDDSRSPSKFVNPAAKRTHLADSDDDLFDFDINATKGASATVNHDDVEQKLAAIYAKYDTPRKQQPITSNVVQLTPEDKLNLDMELRMNDTYTNAQKKLDEDLQKVQQSSQSLPIKTGIGKFKYNRPRAQVVSISDVSSESIGANQSITNKVQTIKILTAMSKPKPTATITSNSLKNLPSTNGMQSTFTSVPKPKPVATVTTNSFKPIAQWNATVPVVKDLPTPSNQTMANSTTR